MSPPDRSQGRVGKNKMEKCTLTSQTGLRVVSNANLSSLVELEVHTVHEVMSCSDVFNDFKQFLIEAQ